MAGGRAAGFGARPMQEWKQAETGGAAQHGSWPRRMGYGAEAAQSTACCYMGAVAGTRTPSGPHSPRGDKDGEKIFPANGCRDGTEIFLSFRDRDRESFSNKKIPR